MVAIVNIWGNTKINQNTRKRVSQPWLYDGLSQGCWDSKAGDVQEPEVHD